MLREIRKKLIILGNRSPFPQEVKDYLNDLEYREWIYMNMRLAGSVLTVGDIDAILRGECIMEATVEDHLMLDRLTELRNYIYRLTDLRADLSPQILRDMQAITAGKRDNGKGEAIRQIMYFAGELQTENGVNPLERAAGLHNLIRKLEPFEENCDMLARAVMYYVVAQAGYPLTALKLTVEEYRQAGDSRQLAQLLGQAVSERLDLMMQLTCYEN